MALLFQGVFARGDRDAMADLVERLGGRGRLFGEPFAGFGVAFRAEGDPPGPSEAPSDMALLAWTRRWPALDLVYLEIEESEDGARQSGYVARAGAIALRAFADPDEPVYGPLRRLFHATGVTLPSVPFAPLERGFFPERAEV